MEAGHRASTTTGSFALNAMRPSVTPQITPSQASFVMPSRPSSKPFYSAPRPHNFSQAPQATAQAIQLEEPTVSDNETRSEGHTSELQSLMRRSYAVFCSKKKKKTQSI